MRRSVVDRATPRTRLPRQCLAHGVGLPNSRRVWFVTKRLDGRIFTHSVCDLLGRVCGSESSLSRVRTSPFGLPVDEAFLHRPPIIPPELPEIYVPLNRPALSLGTGPRGVQDARRWVAGAFEGMGRSDLRECAEVAVSELVTNALLHGQPPIQVRVRGTQEHPRVEVRDGSSDPPHLPVVTDIDDVEETLLTFGRGLNIVARASEAWGAEIEAHGKLVWFTPARDFSDDPGDEPLITGAEGSELIAELAVDPEHFDLRNVPVVAYVAFQNHFRELRREVRLLTLAHGSDYPLARDLSIVFDTLGRPLTVGIGSAQVAAALATGRSTADLVVTMGRVAARGLDRFIELLDLTDTFCREERMLSLARSPEQRRFQNWFLGEFVRQSDGAEPRAWSASNDDSTNGAEGRHSSVS